MAYLLNLVRRTMCILRHCVENSRYPFNEYKNIRGFNFPIERVFYRGFLSNICMGKVFQKASFLHRVILYKAIYGAA